MPWPRCTACGTLVERSVSPSGKPRYFHWDRAIERDHEPQIAREAPRPEKGPSGGFVHEGQHPPEECPTCDNIVLHRIGLRTRPKDPLEDDWANAGEA